MTRLTILLILLVALLGCSTAAEIPTDDHGHSTAEAGHVPQEEMADNMADHMADMPTDNMAGHGDTSTAGAHNSAEPIPGAAEIRIVATEFGFVPATLELVAGEPVNIVLVNEGLLPHELGIKELEFHAHAEAGETVSVGFTPEETGEFEFGCYIAGHYEAGMFGEATIETN
ncbi:MAG: cupredoxin domain-containing protein [Chloroflexi bacterium]|nr:cupredoxin domain-containing protein [Chloroflexota bacterium]